MDEGTPRFRYDARLANEIELRWQDRWEREGTFHSPNPPGPEGPDALSDGALSAGFGRVAGRPKFYLVDFFPYPSGIGLHVGHPLGYIGTDVFGRLVKALRDRYAQVLTEHRRLVRAALTALALQTGLV